MASQRIGYAVITVAVLAVIGKALGFVRDMVFAAHFGISPEMDALVMAELFPGALGDILVYCLPAVFLPIYRTYLEQKGPTAAKNLADKFASLVFTSTLLVSAVYFFCRAEVIDAVSPGAATEKLVLATGLAGVLFPITVLYGLLGFAVSVLQAHHNYRILVLSSFPLNLMSIMVVLILANSFGIYAGALAMLSGLIIQVIFIWSFLVKSGYNPKFILDISDPGIRQILKLSVPVIVTVGFTTVNPYLDRYFAANFADGSVAALTYATRVNSAIVGVFTASLVTIMFPNFSEKIAGDDRLVFQEQFILSVKNLLFITVPLVVFTFLFSMPIVELLFERGAFDASATWVTGVALMFFSLGLVGTSFNELLNKAYYANLHTVIPSFVAGGMLTIKIGLSIILGKYLMHGGLALATSISVSVGAVCLVIHFWKRYRIMANANSLLFNGLKILVAAIAAGLVAYWFFSVLCSNMVGNLNFIIIKVLCLSISLTAGTVLYLVSTYLLKCNEAVMVFDLFRARLSKLG